MAEEKSGSGGGAWASIAALIPVVFRAIGAAVAAGDRQTAERMRQNAIREYNIELPTLEQLDVELQSNTQLQNVVANGRYTEAENETLGRLQDYATGSGLTAQDIGTLERARLEAANYERGVLGRNEMQQAARGQLGSGADLANQMAASQAGINRAYQGSVQTASDAANRRFQALGLYGGMATRLKQNDLSQKNRAAEAQDRINQFNTADRRYTRNYNAALPQQQFNNELGLADRKYKAYRQRGDDYEGYADRTENTYADVGEGVGRSVEAIGDEQETAGDLMSIFGGFGG